MLNNDDIRIGDEIVRSGRFNGNYYALIVTCVRPRGSGLLGVAKDGRVYRAGGYYWRKTGRHFDGFEEAINQMLDNDEVKAEEQRLVELDQTIGHWIHRNDDHNDWLECSGCGYGDEGEVKFGEGTNFCPNCGRKMMEV